MQLSRAIGYAFERSALIRSTDQAAGRRLRGLGRHRCLPGNRECRQAPGDAGICRDAGREHASSRNTLDDELNAFLLCSLRGRGGHFHRQRCVHDRRHLIRNDRLAYRAGAIRLWVKRCGLDADRAFRRQWRSRLMRRWIWCVTGGRRRCRRHRSRHGRQPETGVGLIDRPDVRYRRTPGCYLSAGADFTHDRRCTRCGLAHAGVIAGCDPGLVQHPRAANAQHVGLRQELGRVRFRDAAGRAEAHVM